MIRIGSLCSAVILLAGLLWLALAAPTTAEDVPAVTESGAVVAASQEPDVADDLPAANSGMSRQEALIASVTIFLLAIFVGFEIITKVPPTLHTPLMSGSNAISGITLVGAVLTAGSGQSNLAAWLGMFAVILATINVVGGFMVTDRMLGMFRKK